MCVNSARPLMSPTAYSHGTAGTRICASTSTNAPGSSPMVSMPRSSVPGPRPTAMSTTSPDAVVPAEVFTATPPPFCEKFTTEWPVSTSTPNSCSAAARLERLRQLGALRPGAHDNDPPGDLVGGGRLAVGPHATRLELTKPLERRHQRLRAHREDHGLPRFQFLVSHHHPTLAHDPTVTADQRDPVALQPRQQRRIVRSADDLVAPAQHRRHVQAAVDRLSRARDASRLGERLVRP